MVCVVLGSPEGASGTSKPRKLLRNPSLIREHSSKRHINSPLESHADVIRQRHRRQELQQNDKGPVFYAFKRNGAPVKALSIDRGEISKERIEDAVRAKREKQKQRTMRKRGTRPGRHSSHNKLPSKKASHQSSFPMSPTPCPSSQLTSSLH